jgi:hypothetical protein
VATVEVKKARENKWLLFAAGNQSGGSYDMV